MNEAAIGVPTAKQVGQHVAQPDGGELLRAVALAKSFRTGQGTLEIFRDLSFAIQTGEMVAIVGESGTGKSSLLHLLAALERPSAGEVWYGDTRVDSLRGAEAARFRNTHVGYVWQFHYLLPEFSAEENVAMPLLARGERAGAAKERARGLLAEVGLADRVAHRSGELSGGEQQRVSIARALATSPSVLLADEPTGDLDQRTSERVVDLLRSLHEARGLTSVLVTHNAEVARRCNRVMRLTDGKLIEVAAAQGFADLPGAGSART